MTKTTGLPISDELVDITDEKGIFIKTVAKSEAHQQGLLHKCVIGQVINAKGQFLLVRQTLSRQDPGQFVLPIGGHIKSGEAELEALQREAYEELNFDSDLQTQRVGKMLYIRDVLGRHEHHLFIVFKIFSNQIPEMGEEADKFRYFSPKQLSRLLKMKSNKLGDPAHRVYHQLFPELLN